MQSKKYSLEIGEKKLNAEFTDLADQANGSVLVNYGDTTVLVTAVMSKNKREEIDYFPLTVDYEERFYAGGKIQGSRFMRREGRPSDEAILSGRIVDRTIRPLFDSYIRNEVQVVVTVLSLGEDDPDVPAVIGASLALGTSNIPWNGPVSAIRIGKNGGAEFKVQPTYVERSEEGFSMDLLACGKDGNINMIEVASNEIGEEETVKALEKASEEIEKIQTFQKQIIKEIGKEKTIIPKPETPEELKELFNQEIEPKLEEVMFAGPGSKGMYELKDFWLKIALEKLPEISKAIPADLFEDRVNDLLHSEAIDNNRRPDGRTFDEVRPLFAKAGGISSMIHGTGIFYRGGTHILSALTLGAPGDSQVIDNMEYQLKKRFMHHYNFPPFSSGETGRIGGLNRRMIGHGALAEKALIPVLPNKDDFPYTIRIVSESLASNGSTSMGSVCGSTLALMDAGVPIKTPVAGIASGLMMKDENNYKVLTDIQGPEDHHGDMDFKVAGTKTGITAVQMDVKVDGIPLKVFPEAFEKARLARLQIIDVIEKEIPAPRADISPRAPKILSLKINPDKIGMVIGTGGKTINEIVEKTGVESIDIDDDGTVYITGKDGSADKAKEIVASMTKEFVAGEEVEGEVVKIADFGAFVKLNPSTDGLVHISEIAPFRVAQVSDFLKVGDKVPVKVLGVDDRGKIKLSIKAIKSDLFKQK